MSIKTFVVPSDKFTNVELNLASIEVTNYYYANANIFHLDFSCRARIKSEDVILETEADFLADSNTPLEFGDIAYFDKGKDEIAYLEGDDYDKVINVVKVKALELLATKGLI